MEFNHTLPDWKNEGAEPSNDLKENGYQGGQRPPAALFNWFWSKVTKAISELQEKFGAHADDKNNPHGVTTAQLGLDKVDNTPDSQKNVAFASEAGVGRKVKYPLVFRLNGGSAEGTSMWTFDGAVSKSVNLTPDKLGAAKADLGNVEDETIKDRVEGVITTGIHIIPATSADGVHYTATLEGVTELYNGLQVTIIPDTRSTQKAFWLDLNGLGEKRIYQPLSFSTFVATQPSRDYFLYENVPVRLMYHESYTTGGIWLMADKQKTSAQDLYGSVPIESGGTGASDAKNALANLGVDMAGLFFADEDDVTCLYRTVNGEKEWLIPPMANGVTYRTAERFLGYPVYVAAFYLETVNGQATLFLDADGNAKVTDIRGIYLAEDDEGNAYNTYRDVKDAGSIVFRPTGITGTDDNVLIDIGSVSARKVQITIKWYEP